MARLLIVPEAVETEIGESFLDRRSFSVKTASDALDALAVAAEWRPGLIIFGSELDGMTSEEFTRTVNDDPAFGGAKLLMIASEPDRSGAHAHVARPIDRGVLLEKIGGLLNVQVRRSRRRTVQLQADMEYKSDRDGSSSSIVARILRLSETGVLIACEPTLKAGAVIRVEFSLPQEAEPLRSTCIVLFVDKTQPHYGVEFVDMGAQERKRIRKYVGEV